jgi:hypothetical protein
MVDMVDTNKLRAVWCDDETSHLVTDPEALYWSDSVAVTVLCDEIDRLRAALELIVREQEKGPIKGLYHGGETYCGLGQRLRNVAVAALKGIEINTGDEPCSTQQS